MNWQNNLVLNTGWKFKFVGDESLQEIERNLTSGAYIDGPASRSFDDSAWREVEIPHDFVVEGERVRGEPIGTDPRQANIHAWRGSYPTGVGWYRKHFTVPDDITDARIYVLFDGVFRDARIYVNDFFIGHHPSGYTSFWFDITDFLEIGRENLLAVRADARGAEGWYYEGGGIYRPAKLVQVPAVHIVPYGVRAIAEIRDSKESPKARISITTEIQNTLPRVTSAQLVSTVIHPSGRKIATAIDRIEIPPSGLIKIEQEIDLDDVVRWDLAHPALYRLESRLETEGRQNAVVDTAFGIRSIHFDPARGFFLNGKAIKIHGACCHQDHAGLGTALTPDLQAYRVGLLKEMGCNAIRTAHHPPAPELLDVCDRLGMLVMTENRRLSSAPEDLRDLEALIRIDRNHPCVIIRSLGNEEVHIQQRPQSARITRRLIEFSRRLDPSRPSTLGLTYWNIATNKPDGIEFTSSAAAELEVMGFNYSPDLWEEYHRLHPAQPIVVSEASSNLRTRGCYTSDDPRQRLSVYDPRTNAGAELQWRNVSLFDFLSGIFIWTGFDYRGEPVPSDWPAVDSNFGIMDLCGFPKDNYHFYRAAWTQEPIVHLFPHWNWPERIDKVMTVSCHSNCDEVELLVNERSMGRKTIVPGQRCDWEDVIYQPGRIDARGYRRGTLAVSTFVETTDAPSAIRLESAETTLPAGRSRDRVVNVRVVDNLGRTVPTADHLIRFRITGPGKMIGTGNGDPTDHAADKGTQRKAFCGLAQAILRIDGVPGTIELAAESPGLESAAAIWRLV